MRILIIEDSDSISRMIEALVSGRGHVVTAVPSGSKGLELAFANVPDQTTIDEFMGPGQIPPTHPRWKERVPRDNSVGWDFEEVRDHYFKVITGEDPFTVRYSEPARYLELSRMVSGVVMARTFAEWRRPGSSCNGGIVLMLRDLWPGGGWGLIDSLGRPKQALRAVKPVLAPAAVFTTDEGLNGLWVHVVNDYVEASTDGIEILERPTATSAVLNANKPGSISLDEIIGAFTDATYAYRFGGRVNQAVTLDANSHENGMTITWS